MLELARDEVVGDRVEDEAEGRALHPAGLAGEDRARREAGAPAGLDQEPGGRALAERAVGPENRDARAPRPRGSSPLQKWSSVRRAVFRTSTIDDALRARPRRESSGSSDTNSWSPLTTDMPLSIASKRSAREARRQAAARGRDADDAEVGLGSAARSASAIEAKIGDAAGLAVEDLAGVAARGRRVDDAEDPVAVGAAHQAVRGLPVARWRRIRRRRRSRSRPWPAHYATKPPGVPTAAQPGRGDLATLAGAAAVLAAAGTLAAWLPARRAIRVDPLAALRAD